MEDCNLDTYIHYLRKRLSYVGSTLALKNHPRCRIYAGFLLIPDFPYKIMKLLYSCRYFSIILSLLQFTDTFFHYLLYVHYQEVSHVSTLHLFRHNLSGFTSQTHLILYLRHTDHSPCLKYSVCFLLQKKNIKQGKRNRFSHRDKFRHFPFAGAGCHLTPVVKPVLRKTVLSRFIFFENGTPLFYDQYHQTTAEEQLCEKCTSRRRRAYRERSFFTKNRMLSSHTEYQFDSGDNIPYIASVGSIPKGGSYLNFLILRSLARQSHQMLSLRIIVSIANIAAFLLLFLFFHFFIRKC